MSFFATPAYAMDAGGFLNMNTLIQFGPIILIFGIFYFLIIRPQQQKQKQLREQLGSLRRGDQVITAGGLKGTVMVARPDSSDVEIELNANVRVKVVRSTIASVTPRNQPANDVK